MTDTVNMRELIDRVTEEVMMTLARSAPSAAGLAVIFEGLPYTDASTHLIIQGLAESHPGLVFLATPEIVERFGALIPRERMLSESRQEELARAYDRSTHLLLPLLPFSALGKLALLVEDDPPSRLVARALREGKPVLAFPPPSSRLPGNPLEAQAAEYRRRLEARGLRTISADDYRVFATTTDHPPSASSPVDDPCAAITGECNACGHCPTKIEEAVECILRQGASRIGATLGTPRPGDQIARYIDHTLLKPDATRDDILKLCDEARRFGFASVCVNPSFVQLAAEALRGSPVKVCTVIGFPLGATTTIAKVMETRDAIANGAEEIDMVLNVGGVKAGQWELVAQDIEAVREASRGYVLKVILETALLSDPEKVRACEIAKEAGADFVKTSTGFGPGGATEHDVALMRETVGPAMGVKASGGIRDYESAKKMIAAGATRIGASASVAIAQKAAPTGKGY